MIVRCLLGLTAVLAVAGCDQAEQAETAPVPAPVVGVIAAELIEVSPGLEIVGRIEAVDDVDLRARVEGFLLARNFDEGSVVEEGTVLFRIEPDVYKTEIDRISATAEGARAELDLAVIEQARQRKLVEKDVVAQRNLDQAIAQEAASKALLDQNLALLERAELDLSYTEIRAPFSGSIGRANYSEGDFVDLQSEPLATLVRMDPVFVRINLSMRDMLNIRSRAESGDYVPYLRLANGAEYPLPGEWAFTEPKVDPLTDTVPVRATFANPDDTLLPGAFVTMIARRSEPVQAVAVPQGAIQEDQAGRFLMIVGEGDTAEMRRVTLGDQVEANWIVEEGLVAGEQVIVQGLQKVRPGVAIDAQPVETIGEPES